MEVIELERESICRSLVCALVLVMLRMQLADRDTAALVPLWLVTRLRTHRCPAFALRIALAMPEAADLGCPQVRPCLPDN